MSPKTFATWGGIILLVLGVIGIPQGNRLGPLNSDLLEDVIHLIVGALFFIGGLKGSAAQAASWARTFGVVFLVVGVAGFVTPNLVGLLPSGLGPADNIVHLIYGAIGAWAGFGYKT